MKDTTLQLVSKKSLLSGDNITTMFVVTIFAGLFIYAIANRCELKCKYGNVEIIMQSSQTTTKPDT